MKKILLSALLAITAFSAVAEMNGDGFYRVRHAVTKRYTYLLDNKGSFDAATTSADVNALELYKGFLKASSDPATVFYINKIPGTQFEHNVAGQGTSLYDFLGVYLKIISGKEYDGARTYLAYGTNSGFTKYLGDLFTDTDIDEGFPSVDAKGDDRLWYINPLNATDDEGYFGIKPTVTADGKYYYPFFAGFPYSAYSEGVKFYSVIKVDPKVKAVVVRELNGYIPKATPVIVECANPLAVDNRLNIGEDGSMSDCSGNMLKGVYFNSGKFLHVNRLEFNQTSMRCLASDNGKLVFAKANHEFVPRNEAYLELPSDARGVDTFEVMSEEKYQEICGVDGVMADDAEVEVYSVDGVLLKSGIRKSEVTSLGHGVYILRSAGNVEKMLVR